MVSPKAELLLTEQQLESLLETQTEVINTFQELWEERAKYLKRLVSKRRSVDELLEVNRKESQLVRISEKKCPQQLEKLRASIAGSPEELKGELENILAIANAWIKVIGMHQEFLDVEKATIEQFMTSKKSRQQYFDTLESALRVYLSVIQRHTTEKIIGDEIQRISNKKLNNVVGTSIASFKYGYYRIIGATALGALFFGSTIPGGNTAEFIKWTLFVNIAGTLLSFIDIKVNTARRINTIINESLYVIRPTLN